MNPLGGLLPELVAIANRHKTVCRHEGIEVMLVQGYRTFAEQLAIYSEGRAPSASGWVVTDAAKIVTRALPDQSAHCRRAAYDVAILQNGKIVWSGIDPLYVKVGELGEELGLSWGGRFPHPDLDHFELKHWQDLPVV